MPVVRRVAEPAAFESHTKFAGTCDRVEIAINDESAKTVRFCVCADIRMVSHVCSSRSSAGTRFDGILRRSVFSVSHSRRNPGTFIGGMLSGGPPNCHRKSDFADFHHQSARKRSKRTESAFGQGQKVFGARSKAHVPSIMTRSTRYVIEFCSDDL
jgi:hypothetical protein